MYIIYIYMYMRTYMYIQIYTHIHSYMHIHMYVHVYIYTHIHTCIYGCTHTRQTSHPKPYTSDRGQTPTALPPLLENAKEEIRQFQLVQLLGGCNRQAVTPLSSMQSCQSCVLARFVWSFSLVVPHGSRLRVWCRVQFWSYCTEVSFSLH